MLFYKRVWVGDQTRELVIRKGRFERILQPGVYTLWGWGLEVEEHELSDVELRSKWSEFLMRERPEVVQEHFHLVETAADEVALISRNGRLIRVQGPGERTLYWKTASRLEADRFEIERVKVLEAPLASRTRSAAVLALGSRGLATPISVEEGKCGLLFLDGKYREALSPGLYAAWNAVAKPSVELMDLRMQTVEIPGQEILTADKVSIRVNIWGEYQIVDPLLARQSVKNPVEHLYKVLQLAVRQTLAKRTLDEVLASRTDLDASVQADVRTQAAAFGIRIGSIAVKDIIPPGEVRDILNQVVAAEKRAQANLIERREETAATRSLLNTAKLMAENPLLLRMKELETIEKIAGKVEKIHLSGGFEALIQKLVVLDSK
jgi:regulator of protease activity HflC (stomatin/prohibitin superfamily)